VDNAPLIAEAYALAWQGEVVDIPFAARDSGVEDVEAVWGTPATQDSVGAGIYVSFPDEHAAFGFNKGDQIIDVRSSSPKLQAITLSQVESVLGEPGIVRHASGQTILLYAAGADFQLRWVFPEPDSAQPDPRLDHVSLLYPRGTVNLMAQNVPDPSAVIKDAPGAGGSFFTFAIKDVPDGYPLVELEWVPVVGPAVVNTLPQVEAHGSSGGSEPCFRVSADGKTWSFAYTPLLKGQSGVLSLICQDSDGAAIIGDSDSITLK
jgi:hypothetical protein